jgi:hypothetical protein
LTFLLLQSSHFNVSRSRLICGLVAGLAKAGASSISIKANASAGNNVFIYWRQLDHTFKDLVSIRGRIKPCEPISNDSTAADSLPRQFIPGTAFYKPGKSASPCEASSQLDPTRAEYAHFCVIRWPSRSISRDGAKDAGSRCLQTRRRSSQASRTSVLVRARKGLVSL